MPIYRVVIREVVERAKEFAADSIEGARNLAYADDWSIWELENPYESPCENDIVEVIHVR